MVIMYCPFKAIEKGIYMKRHAILFDTRSIQSYIFSGNTLKTNIGASYIVETLFSKLLCQDVLKSSDFNFTNVDIHSYQEEQPIPMDESIDCQIAYIGGGNALVLFKESISEETLQNVVKAFTKKVLVTYPGLRTGAAIGTLRLDQEYFWADLGQLYKTLKMHQNTVSPCVSIPDTGLTLPCRVNGQVANAFDNIKYRDNDEEENDKEKIYLISQEVGAKNAKSEEASKYLHDEFEDVLDVFEFPVKFDDLGQKKATFIGDVGENTYAIVHIDGNDMGNRFQACKDLETYRRLSAGVARHTKEAFKQLLQSIVAEHSSYIDFIKLESKEDSVALEKAETFVPIRPLILGGDDITFVCNAKMALSYTKRFMTFLREAFELPSGTQVIDSCAGIAILPTSYPFFRGYELAEQLCDCAKKAARAYNQNHQNNSGHQGSSWLDFAILHGEQAPTLEQIREQEYTGVYNNPRQAGDLHFGPYRVDEVDSVDTQSHHIHHLIETVKAFQGVAGKTLAKGKIKELRNVLQSGQHEATVYLDQLKRLQVELPMTPMWSVYATSLWAEEGDTFVTPLIDVIEMMDYIVDLEATTCSM